MASAPGIVAAGRSKVVSNQWDAPSSMPTSDSLQVRATCANSASFSSCSVASASKFLRFPRRGLRNHGGVRKYCAAKGLRFQAITETKALTVTQRRHSGTLTRRRLGVKVDAEGGEGEESPEAVSERWSLDELDQQLKVLSSRESSAPRQIPIPRQALDGVQVAAQDRGGVYWSDSDGQQNTVNGNWPKLEWPTLTTGFFVYAAIGLVLLTIVDNVLYKIFLGPPGVDRTRGFKTSVPEMPRFRITTRQEEREAREAKEAGQEAIASQSRETSPPLD